MELKQETQMELDLVYALDLRIMMMKDNLRIISLLLFYKAIKRTIGSMTLRNQWNGSSNNKNSFRMEKMRKKKLKN